MRYFYHIQSNLNNSINMSFRENLKDELKFQDIRIKELSEKTGISIGTLNHYLAEKSTEPTVENALKIANALNVTVEYLVTGKYVSSKQKKDFEINMHIYKKYFNLLLKMDNLQPESLKALEILIDNMK